MKERDTMMLMKQLTIVQDDPYVLSCRTGLGAGSKEGNIQHLRGRNGAREKWGNKKAYERSTDYLLADAASFFVKTSS